MASIPWCTRQHDLTNPANIYTTRNGKRYCLPCKHINQRAYRMLLSERAKPNKHRKWARETWDNMSDQDRWLVRQALISIETEPSP